MPKSSSKSNRSRQKSARSGFSRRGRKFEPLEVIAIALIAVAIGFLGAHKYDNATHAAPNNVVCNGKGWCLNRSGGGTANGAHVLAWTNDGDNNENFVIIATSIPGCGSTVQNNSKLQCPFTVGSGLNARYAGDPINELFTNTTSTAEDKCVGTDGSGNGVLQYCGTGTGTYMIANNGYFIDRYWSNINYTKYGLKNTPSFTCGYYYKSQIVFSSNGQAGTCTWSNQFPK